MRPITRLSSFLAIQASLAISLAACQAVTTPALPTTGADATQEATPTSVLQPTVTAKATPTTQPEIVEIPEPDVSTPTLEMPQPDGSVLLTQAAQHGGELMAVAVESGIAYTGFGPSLLSFRLNDNAPPEMIGEPFALNFLAHDLAALDGLLYLLDGEGHLYLFGVSDPESTYVIQAFERAGTSRVFVQDEWGFTTSETCTVNGCSSLLDIFPLEGLAETQPVFGPDEIGPRLPVQASLEIAGKVHEVLVSGETVFIAHEGGLLAASLPGLQVLDEMKTQYIRDAAIAWPYAYLSGNELIVTDLSNPQALTRSSSPRLATFPLTKIGERLYGFDTFGEFGLCWSTLQSLSIEEPTAPVLVELEQSLPQFSCAWRAEAAGNTLLVIDWDGLHFLDLSDPDQPDLLYSYAHIPGYLDLVQAGWAFGGSDRGPASLWAHDLRDLEQIRSYGPFAPRWAIQTVALGDYLFAPVWEDGLAVVDISDPSRPSLAAELTTEQTRGTGLDAALLGDYLYLARGEGGVGVFDVSDPARPALIGEISPPQYEGPWKRTSRVTTGEGILVALEEIWEGDFPDGILQIFNLDDPANPEQAGQIEIEEPFRRSALDSAARTVYFMGSNCQETCTHRILIADLANPDAPAILSSLHQPGEAYDISLSGEYLFVAAGREGIYVWDVSDPANPVLAAHADTPGSAEKVVIVGEWVYVSDRSGGLVVLILNLCPGLYLDHHTFDFKIYTFIPNFLTLVENIYTKFSTVSHTC